jgi:prephenate dehydratase
MELRNIRVAIQGSKASFHDEAARTYFGPGIEIIFCKNFEESCEALASNRVDYTVMAMGNSIAGNILPNYELVLKYKLSVMAEIYRKIALHLVGIPETSKGEIRRICSHPMALLQCASFIDSLEGVEVVEGGDTALCVREIADLKLVDTAAIAGYQAVEEYGMHILKENIHSQAHNYTRFWVLSKGEVLPENVNKASLSFTLKDEAGSLADILFIFRSEGLNLSSIQSVYLPEGSRFRFYADVEFSYRPKFLRCLQAIIRAAEEVKILGEYKRDLIPQG